MTQPRIGLLWRGERGGAVSPRAEAMLGPLLSAFADQGVAARHVIYADDAVAEVRSELLDLDGVLVWVNPIQEGATRAKLDALLREVVAAGVWVSARPDIIDAMGTKEVLFETRDLGWGTDVGLYRSPEELAHGFPARLAANGRLVIKQARGTGGTGVWRVELPAGPGREVPGRDSAVLIQRADARRPTPFEPSTLGDFLDRCDKYFAWSGSIIDQPFQERLEEGMIRAYFVHDEVVGFCHQWPKGLVVATGAEEAPVSTPPKMEDPDTPAYASLRSKADSEWVPGLKDRLGLSTHDLPAIWDADFLYGPKAASGEDTYVLCEINVQAVWPYPPQANPRLAEAVTARISEGPPAEPRAAPYDRI